MVSPGLLAFAIALSGMSIASYVDIQKREVPNRISFGLIISMIVLRFVYAYQTHNIYNFWFALAVGAGFLGLGLLFFYAQQWGGADVKLLVVLGIGFATIYPEFSPVLPVSWPFFLTILTNFLFIAAAYSLLYSFLLAFSNKNVYTDLKASLGKYELLLGVLSIITIYFIGRSFSKFFYALYLIPFFWFLMKYLKAIDKNCMYRIVKADTLVEFDVPQNSVKVGNKTVVDAKDPNGMTIGQIDQIKKYIHTGKLKNEFKIKWGIPLIPVFPITLVASLYFGDIYFAIIRWIIFGKILF